MVALLCKELESMIVSRQVQGAWCRATLKEEKKAKIIVHETEVFWIITIKQEAGDD